MKIIFLDIDGVLNNDVFYDKEAHQKQYEETGNTDDIDPRNMKLLNELIKNTDAKVVISSTWRLHKTAEMMQKRLEVFGFEGEIIGLTPWEHRGPFTVRGNEIYAWLYENEELLGCPYYDFNTYVILDDDSDMLYWQRDNMIIVDSYTGLTPRNIYKAEYILNKKYRRN